MTRRFSKGRACHPGLLLGMTMAFGHAAAIAATPPDAGQTLQELRTPAPPVAPPPAPALEAEAAPAARAPADGTPIPVLAVSITGNTVIATPELLALVADLPGTRTLAELQAAAARITAHYRARGYLLARAWLPPQELRDGQLTIAILEGTVDRVVVANDSAVGQPQVQGVLDAQLPAGQPVRRSDANRALLILQQTPGIGRVQGSLRPGAAVGSTEVRVKLGPQPRVSGALTADNFGNRYTGQGRVLGNVDFNSLAGYGDRLSLQAVVTEQDQLDYGRLGWDAPVGRDGLRVGLAFSNTRYELGDAFAALGATGTARTASLYGHYPRVLAPDVRVRAGLALEHRELHDEQASVLQDNRKSADSAVLSLDGDFTDAALGGNAITAWRVAATYGRLDIETASALAIDTATARTASDYGKLVVDASREQGLTRQLAVYLGGSLQAASRNLDSSEQFVLGGPGALRAYPTGEAVGDAGWLATAELRWRLARGLRLDAFYDAGHVQANRDPYIAQANGRSLDGGGLAATASWKNFTLEGSLAWRGDREPTSDRDRHPRGWIAGRWTF